MQRRYIGLQECPFSLIEMVVSRNFFGQWVRSMDVTREK